MEANLLILLCFFFLFGGEIALAVGIGVLLKRVSPPEEIDNTPRRKIGFGQEVAKDDSIPV